MLSLRVVIALLVLLDELPQPWHVLSGEVSLGPRPEAPFFVACESEHPRHILDGAEHVAFVLGEMSGLGDAEHMIPCAFWSVASSRHFIGAVVLLNSLRLTGHQEALVLLDAGLTERQRAALAPPVTLLAAPADTPAVFLASCGPFDHPPRSPSSWTPRSSSCDRSWGLIDEARVGAHRHLRQRPVEPPQPTSVRP